jgi:hypothetical protein
MPCQAAARLILASIADHQPNPGRVMEKLGNVSAMWMPKNNIPQTHCFVNELRQRDNKELCAGWC